MPPLSFCVAVIVLVLTDKGIAMFATEGIGGAITCAGLAAIKYPSSECSSAVI